MAMPMAVTVAVAAAAAAVRIVVARRRSSARRAAFLGDLAPSAGLAGVLAVRGRGCAAERERLDYALVSELASAQELLGKASAVERLRVRVD